MQSKRRSQDKRKSNSRSRSISKSGSEVGDNEVEEEIEGEDVMMLPENQSEDSISLGKIVQEEFPSSPFIMESIKVPFSKYLPARLFPQGTH